VRWIPQETGTRWNRIRIYSSATSTGTFTLAKEVDSSYCYWWDQNSPSTQYYKLTWYDSIAAVETDYSTAFTTSTVIISTKELRRFMGLNDNETPDDNVMMGLILDANTEYQADTNITSTENAFAKLVLKMLSASYVCQWRAQQMLNSGNISFAIDGVSVQRPYQFLMDQAKYWRTQYDETLYKYCEESLISKPAYDLGYFDASNFLVEILSGENNFRNKPDLRSFGNNVVYINDTVP